MRFQKLFFVVFCLMLVSCSANQSIPSQSEGNSLRFSSRVIEDYIIADSFNTVNDLYGFQEISISEFYLLRSKYLGKDEDFLADAAAISQAVAADVGSVSIPEVSLQTTVSAFITSELWDDGLGI